MGITFPVFKTKFKPPQIKNTILRRPTLARKLQEIPTYPLTLIQSGPGYGKSTSLAAFLKDGGHAYCWLSLSKQDDDIVPFLYYLIHSLQSYYPDFGNRLLKRFENFIDEEDIRILCAEFVNELTDIEEELTIVIDDYHLISHSELIERWMVYLIEYLPETIHIVVASRTKLTWDILTNLRAKGEVLELNERDFIFSSDEIEVLLADAFHAELSEREVSLIYNQTEGWIMAIQMIGTQLARGGRLEAILNNQSKSLDDLFQFLAYDVVSKQPESIQLFLMESSIFEEMDPIVLANVLAIDDSKNIIDRIERENLLLFSLEDKQYRYHALFREFLWNKLLMEKPQLFHDLHAKAGHYFNDKERYEEALYHFKVIENWQGVAEILHHHGQKMLDLGLLESLKDKISLIPADVKNDYPMLWIYEGEISRYRCIYEKAMRCYENAKYAADINYNIQILALQGIGRIYLDTIQPGKADLYLKRAISLLSLSSISVEQTNQLYRLMAENLLNSGRADEAKKWVVKGTNLPQEEPFTENLEARLFLRTGQLDQAIALLNQQHDHEKQSHLQQSHRETVLLLSLIYSFKGEMNEAKLFAEEGVKQGKEHLAPFTEACGWMRLGHALLLSKVESQNEAVHCYKKALNMMETIHVPRGKAEPLMGLCILYSQMGDYDRASYYAEQALMETDRVDDGWLSALITLSNAISHFYKNDLPRTKELLHVCMQFFETCIDYYGLTVCLLWESIIAFREKNWALFDHTTSRCFNIIQTNNYDFLFKQRTLFGPFDRELFSPVLLEAQKRQIHSGYVSDLIASLGIRNSMTHPGYTLRIYSMGAFQVMLGNKQLSEKDWSRDKAKELFQLLLSKRGIYITREEIYRTLWSDQDEASASAGLKVAVNALNKALEPFRKARAKPFYLERQATSYRLNMHSGIEWDVLEFERWVQDGLNETDRVRAMEWLKIGLNYYKGEYLPERHFEDWCMNEREQIQVLYLRGAEKLTQLYVSFQQYGEAITWCEAILKLDPNWEESYRLLMFCYYQQNNRAQAIKYYQKCFYQLKTELGVGPMPATKQMYEMIVETG